MLSFLETLRYRNSDLFYFGLACLVSAVLFGLLVRLTGTQVAGVNAWYKPLKFALSIGILAWTMAWYTGYLAPSLSVKIYNWTLIILFGLEILYIAIQAGRGQLSHYNVSSPFYSFMYFFMAAAATVVTLHTAYIGLLFFGATAVELPQHYLWSIRAGFLLFAVFSFEGFVMGSAMRHTVGATDGSGGLPLLNWSTRFGDLRVAHFVGMHALQVLPFLSWYLLKQSWMTLVAFLCYACLAAYILWQALEGKPFIRL